MYGKNQATKQGRRANTLDGAEFKVAGEGRKREAAEIERGSRQTCKRGRLGGKKVAQKDLTQTKLAIFFSSFRVFSLLFHEYYLSQRRQEYRNQGCDRRRERKRYREVPG